MSRPEFEEAQLLLRKAREDADAVAKLAPDGDTADTIVGFHAQQAVEKALKAVLAASGEDFPWTHDLRYLIERLNDLDVPPPPVLHDVRLLSPWAVEFRYGETIDDSLDRQQAIALVTETITWVEAQLETRAAGQTQPVQASDLENGVLRVPNGSKWLFPAERCRIKVVLRDADLGEVSWDPRFEPDRERSGRIGIGPEAVAGLEKGSVLRIARIDDGVLQLD